MPVTRTSFNEILILLVATGVFYLAIAYILINFTDSTVPYLDSFTTAASITATWMLARKMLEHWIFGL
jgi:nicotinamide mononucleotide transporter